MIRSNEATLNRPLGNRVIQAPEVFVSLADANNILKSEKAWKENDRNGITLFKADELSVVLTALKKNAIIENIKVSGFMTLQVLEGRITLMNNNSGRLVCANEMLMFNPCVQYSVIADEESSILLTHYYTPGENRKIF